MKFVTVSKWQNGCFIQLSRHKARIISGKEIGFGKNLLPAFNKSAFRRRFAVGEVENTCDIQYEKELPNYITYR